MIDIRCIPSHRTLGFQLLCFTVYVLVGDQSEAIYVEPMPGLTWMCYRGLCDICLFQHTILLGEHLKEVKYGLFPFHWEAFIEKKMSEVICAQCVLLFINLTQWRPDKKRWQGVSQMMCKHCWRGLKAYPYILMLYLEKNGENEKHLHKTPVNCFQG